MTNVGCVCTFENCYFVCFDHGLNIVIILSGCPIEVPYSPVA